jgi:hypothetical protein
MTTYQNRRCSHCRVVYAQQTSGHGCHDSDGRYCPSCLAVVNEALKQVPRRFERRNVDVSSLSQCLSVTLDRVLAWKEAADQDAARRRVEGKVTATRVAFPLFDLNNPENRNEARYIVPTDGPFKGVTFLLSTWTQSQDYRLEVEVEWDLEKNEFHDFWRAYSTPG